MNFSLVVQDGPDSYACFVNGQNSFFVEDPTSTIGYADAYLTEYLIHQAQQFALPSLLEQFKKENSSLEAMSVVEPVSNLTFDAVINSELGLSIIFDATSHLPYMIRSHESHAIFGNSTSDLILSAWAPVKIGKNATVLLPHRFQTLYNSINILEDVLIESITINPDFPENYFAGLPDSESQMPKAKPQLSAEYTRAEVGEFYGTGLWTGPFNFNTSDVVVTSPSKTLPQVSSVYVGYPDYVQLMVEFDDGVLLTDAPPHRSIILIDWIATNIGKPINYVVPSHHHHDHAYGVGDYVRMGAKLVVPEVARDFYGKVNNGNVEIVTYNQTHPFVVRDENVQFRSVWKDEAPHARDWSYGIATAACPGKGDDVVVFNADVWSPGAESGADGLRWDTGYARQWLLGAVKDGLSADAIVVGAHGSSSLGTTDALQNLVNITGFAYPPLTAGDWKAGGTFC